MGRRRPTRQAAALWSAPRAVLPRRSAPVATRASPTETLSEAIAQLVPLRRAPFPVVGAAPEHAQVHPENSGDTILNYWPDAGAPSSAVPSAVPSADSGNSDVSIRRVCAIWQIQCRIRSAWRASVAGGPVAQRHGAIFAIHAAGPPTALRPGCEGPIYSPAPREPEDFASHAETRRHPSRNSGCGLFIPATAARERSRPSAASLP